jgi:hypothetical protein
MGKTREAGSRYRVGVRRTRQRLHGADADRWRNLNATGGDEEIPTEIVGFRIGLALGYLATQCAVLESKADMQKRGQASPDDGDALAFAVTLFWRIFSAARWSSTLLRLLATICIRT